MKTVMSDETMDLQIHNVYRRRCNLCPEEEIPSQDLPSAAAEHDFGTPQPARSIETPFTVLATSKTEPDTRPPPLVLSLKQAGDLVGILDDDSGVSYFVFSHTV